MRRNLFHILIAITAFAAGIVSAALWNSLKAPAPLPVAPTFNSPPATETAVIKFDRPAVTVKRKVKFTCDSGLLRFLLSNLRKNNADMGVDGLIEAFMIEKCGELFEIEKTIDLNGDGRKETIVRTKNNPVGNFFCGSTGNCQTWVVGEEKGRYKIIFDGGVVEEIDVRDKKTGSYRDLAARYHGGMMDHTIASYKYRNGKYLLGRCAEETMTSDGKRHFSPAKLSYCGF
jgi:hypothetical protein